MKAKEHPGASVETQYKPCYCYKLSVEFLPNNGSKACIKCGFKQDCYTEAIKNIRQNKKINESVREKRMSELNKKMEVQK